MEEDKFKYEDDMIIDLEFILISDCIMNRCKLYTSSITITDYKAPKKDSNGVHDLDAQKVNFVQEIVVRKSGEVLLKDEEYTVGIVTNNIEYINGI